MNVGFEAEKLRYKKIQKILERQNNNTAASTSEAPPDLLQQPIRLNIVNVLSRTQLFSNSTRNRASGSSRESLRIDIPAKNVASSLENETSGTPPHRDNSIVSVGQINTTSGEADGPSLERVIPKDSQNPDAACLLVTGECKS